jgi:hypothetical protein
LASDSKSCVHLQSILARPSPLTWSAGLRCAEKPISHHTPYQHRVKRGLAKQRSPADNHGHFTQAVAARPSLTWGPPEAETLETSRQGAQGLGRDVAAAIARRRRVWCDLSLDVAGLEVAGG